MSIKYIYDQFKVYGTEYYVYDHPNIFISQFELVVYLLGEENFKNRIDLALRSLNKGEEHKLFDDMKLNPLNFKFEDYEGKIQSLVKNGRVSYKAITSHYAKDRSILYDIAGYIATPLCAYYDFIKLMHSIIDLGISFNEQENSRFLTKMAAYPIIYYKTRKEVETIESTEYDKYFKQYHQKYTKGEFLGERLFIEYDSQMIFKKYAYEQALKIRQYLRLFGAFTSAKVTCMKEYNKRVLEMSGIVCLWSSEYSRVWAVFLEKLFNNEADDFSLEVDEVESRAQTAHSGLYEEEEREEVTRPLVTIPEEEEYPAYVRPDPKPEVAQTPVEQSPLKKLSFSSLPVEPKLQPKVVARSPVDNSEKPKANPRPEPKAHNDKQYLLTDETLTDHYYYRRKEAKKVMPKQGDHEALERQPTYALETQFTSMADSKFNLNPNVNKPPKNKKKEEACNNN